MYQAISRAALAAIAILVMLPSPAAAGCKAFKYGYVGYTRSGAESFSKKQSLKLASEWKSQNGGAVGVTTIACKPFGFASEWECHATTNVCK